MGRGRYEAKKQYSTFNVHKASQEEKMDGDACVSVQRGVGTSGNTRQYTVITICSDSKKTREISKEIAWIWDAGNGTFQKATN